MTSLDVRQRARELVDQLPTGSLQRAVEFLEALQHQGQEFAIAAESDETSEAALLRVIQWQLPPKERTRLDYLRQRNEAETITRQEHEELLSYVDRIEQQDAERAIALIQLAQLRKVELDTILTEFLPSHAA